MKYKILMGFVALVVLGVVGALSLTTRSSCVQDLCVEEDKASVTGATASFSGSCTSFAASYGDRVLFGNNEDFSNPITYLWAVPPGDGTYGGVYLGYRYGRPQGGINEKGLAFDALALPEARLNPHPELPPRPSSESVLLGRIMGQSASVEEAIASAQGINWGSRLSFQVIFADGTGDAVIIGAGPDGELAFTRKPEGDGYLVGTNFNRANPENRDSGPPCWRYDKAVEMLSQIESQADLTAGYVQSILDAVHVEGAKENTLYSNVFDLRNGAIHLTYWHQFDEVVTLDVEEQIAAAGSPIPLGELFSKETVQRAEEEHQRHVARVARDEWLNKNGKAVIVGGGGMIVLGLAGVIVCFGRRKRDLVSLQAASQNYQTKGT